MSKFEKEAEELQQAISSLQSLATGDQSIKLLGVITARLGQTVIEMSRQIAALNGRIEKLEKSAGRAG